MNPKKGESATVIKKLIIDRKVILEKQNISDDMNEHFYYVGENYNHKYRIIDSSIRNICHQELQTSFI